MFPYQPKLNTEKEKLIKSSSDRQKTMCISKRRFSKGNLIIVPFLFCLFLGEGMLEFVIKEWTLSFIQHQYHINDTYRINSSECEDRNTSDPDHLNHKTIEQKTSLWLMYFKIAEYVPTLITSSIFLSYTDTFGRRYLFILGSLTTLMKCGIVTLTIRYYKSLIYVLIAHLIQGLSGNGFSLFSVSCSYIADLTSPNKNRALGIVAIEVVIKLSTVVSGFLSRYLLETIGLGYFNTLIICSCLNFIAFIAAAFLLPESLPREKRIIRNVFLTMIKRVADFYVSKEFKGLRRCFIILLLSYAFYEVTHINHPPLESHFLLRQPFCWDSTKIHNFQLARQAVSGIFGLVTVQLLQKVVSNEIIAIVSILSSMAFFILERYVDTDLKIYYVTIVGVFSFLSDPMVRGLMSSITTAHKQGALFASVALIQAISALASTVAQNTVYSETFSLLNEFIFLVMAGFCGVACILLIIYCFIKPYDIAPLKHEAKPHDTNNIFDAASNHNNNFLEKVCTNI